MARSASNARSIVGFFKGVWLWVTSASKHRSAGSKPDVSLAQILPMEVLAQIFFECSHPGLPVVYLPPRRELRYPWPWRLGHICSHWRRALWNSSIAVWGTIYIASSQREELALRMLSHILSQTTAPISLSINQYSHSSSGIAKLVLPFSHRFRGLTLSPTPHGPLNALLSTPRSSLQQLEALYLFGIHPNRPLLNANDDAHLHFPSLRKLGISGDTSIAPYLRHFPLAQLTHLSIAGSMIPPPRVHFLLGQCTALVSADFEVCRREAVGGEAAYGHATRETTIVAASLETLTLALMFDLDWTAFLAPLVLPSLRSFSTINLAPPLGSPGYAFANAMSALVHRSNCALTSLALSTAPSQTPGTPDAHLHPALVGLLQETPHLTTLISAYVLEPALVHLVHALLPALDVIDWKLTPTGLDALLDILDHHTISLPEARGQVPRFISIICCPGDGFIPVRERYVAKYRGYEREGLGLTVRSTAYDDFRLLDDRFDE